MRAVQKDSCCCSDCLRNETKLGPLHCPDVTYSGLGCPPASAAAVDNAVSVAGTVGWRYEGCLDGGRSAVIDLDDFLDAEDSYIVCLGLLEFGLKVYWAVVD